MLRSLTVAQRMMQYVPAVLVRFTSLLSIVLNIVAATGRRRWSQQGKVQAENLHRVRLQLCLNTTTLVADRVNQRNEGINRACNLWIERMSVNECRVKISTEFAPARSSVRSGWAHNCRRAFHRSKNLD